MSNTNDAINNDNSENIPHQAQKDSITDNQVDNQDPIKNLPATEQTDFETQFEQQTGYKDVASMKQANKKIHDALEEKANSYKNKFEQSQIKSSILSVSSKAISSEVINEILGHKAQCDEYGVVTIDGIPASDAVENYLNNHPFFAKAEGSPGSAAPHSTSMGNKMNRSGYERLPQNERAYFINEGGTISD